MGSTPNGAVILLRLRHLWGTFTMMTPYQQGQMLGELIVLVMVFVTLGVLFRGVRAAICKVIGHRPVEIMTKVVCWATVIAVVGWLVIVGAPSYLQGAVSAITEQKLQQASECGLRGDYSSAVRLATEVIDRQPFNVTAYALRGTAYRRSGEYSQAIADLDRAIELDSRMSEAYTQRAFARQQSQIRTCSKEILADLNRAIELDATNPLAHILRGNEFADLDDYDAAFADYDQALRLDPRSYSALASRASSKIDLGRLDEARRDLQQALALNPPAGDRRQIEELLHSVKSRGE